MIRALAAFAITLMPNFAWAHTGLGDTAGFDHGFVHPFSGIDHILAMVAVGMIAAELRGRALWLLPLAFVTMMAAGGMLATSGIVFPHIETGIALSVIVFGLALALRIEIPVAAAAVLTGGFALFHGFAHGAEMPPTASGLAYGAGFIAATLILHAAGLAAGLGLNRLKAPIGGPLARGAGAGTALAGLALLAGLV